MTACLECGQPLAGLKRGAEFCGSACRVDFNNRRATRGAEFYDLFMALRFDRSRASALKAWRSLCRMAAEFRREDVAERKSRRS